MEAITVKIRKFIPCHVSNRTVLRAMELLSGIESVFKRFCKQKKNKAAVLYEPEAGLLIENQKELEAVRFGASTLKASGCEVIAAYNALTDFAPEMNIRFADILNELGARGAVWNARLGVSPYSLKRLIVGKLGDVFLIETASENIESLFLNPRYSGFILTFYNDKMNIMKEIHTVYVNKKEDRLFVHNLAGNGRVAGPYDSIEAFFVRRDGVIRKPIYCVGIGKE